MTRFWSSGKLLLSGEYWVLHGASALAVPTKLGQSLSYCPSADPLHWRAVDQNASTWLDLPASLEPHTAKLLKAAEALGGIVPDTGIVTTQLEFDRQWGWGSSSSLVDLVAQWTGVNAMDLHFATSQGSGYDVACARASRAILYQKTGPQSAKWEAMASSHWPTAHFGLLYLGQKQDSQREVLRERPTPTPGALDELSQLSVQLAEAATPLEWSELINELEDRTASWIGRPRIQDLLPDAPATFKSLGAWGGDFVLAVVQEPEDLTYFSRWEQPFFAWHDCVPPLL